MRQTCESKKNRQLYFEIKYLCPTYSSKIDNPSKKVNPFDVNADPNFYEGDCLQIKELRNDLEFYSQIKRFEEKVGIKQDSGVTYIAGLFNDKNYKAKKTLDQMYK